MTAPVQIVTPHLVVDNASDALEFYRKGLGATETMRVPAQDGKRLMHAEINAYGARIFVRDEFPEFAAENGCGKVENPKVLKGTPVTMHMEVANCDDAVKRMVDAGATIGMPPMDAFWGARYGQVIDPFGHSWSFAHPLPGQTA